MEQSPTSLGNLGLFKVPYVGITAAYTGVVLPANAYIDELVIMNTTANAMTGGMKIGTTVGGVDIATAISIGANALFNVPIAQILKRFFSTTSSQTIYLDAVVSWNGVNLNMNLIYGQM